MLEWVLQLDKELLLLLNGLGAPYLDTFMIWMSDKYLWFPMYLYLLFRLYQRYQKTFYFPLFALILVIVCTDQTTSTFMKPFFERLRPCKDETLSELLVVAGKCTGKFGFASGHAANSFGLAAFFYFLERSWVGKGLLAWAAIVSYSRIYLGVHYPGDVLVGAAIGVFYALMAYTFLTRFQDRIRAY